MEVKVLLATLLLFHVGLEWTAAKSFKKMENGLSMVVRSRRALQRHKRSMKSAMASMRIKSVVKSRFAKVKIETEMLNSEEKAKEMTFSVRLPEPAFISEFTMIVDGLEFVGKVKKKELAQAEYEGARDRGNSAGLVTADVRETQAFNVAANVPAQSSVTFTLVYQELLERKLGKYEHSVFINPGQIVQDISVNVFITERTGITTLKTRHPQGGSGERGKATKGYDSQGEVAIDTSVRRSKDQALVTFKPTQTQQRRLLMIPEDDRKVTVIYDVTREVLGGEIQTRDGYFVHFFAPEDLPVLPKSVVFVIDTSGSMGGTKMDQTKTAFETVLKEMSNDDEFNIVTFASRVSVWESNKMVKVTPDNVNRSVRHVQEIRATGATNLNQGVLEAVELLSNATRSDRRLSAIIVLTDGQPTSGVTNELRIRENVKKSINGRISLFCLGFGEYLNHEFLKKLANDNDGIARKIYEDSDADLQLQGFFREVATPLLLNIRIQYNGLNVDKVSKTNVDKYFGGSEVIVVGTMQQHSKMEAQITGLNNDGKVHYSVGSKEISDDFTHSQEDAGEFSNVIERIWAYFTIKGLLEKKVLADTATEKQGYIDETLRLALKYGFVTPLTSMVVVTREDEVTTTAASSTTAPIPPCLNRGIPMPADLTSPIIWCPYIFEGETSTSGTSRQSSSSRRIIQYSRPQPQNQPAYGAFSTGSAQRSIGLSSSYSRPQPQNQPAHAASSTGSAQRSMGLSSSNSRSQAQNQQAFAASSTGSVQGSRGLSSSYAFLLSSYGSHSYSNMQPFAYYDDRDYYGPQPDLVPVVSTHCGGYFNQSNYTITLPNSLADHHDGTVICEWNIELQNGSWIDLYIEEIQTSDTEVEITSEGEKVYEHGSGDGAFKYISLESNKLGIRMTIDTKTTSTETIKITYNEFVPNDVGREEQYGSDSQPTFTECGVIIPPSDGNPGLVSSPKYPSRYPPKSRCSWNITNNDPDNYNLTLDLVDIDIETDAERHCTYDKLTIRQAGQQDKIMCGQQTGTIEVSSSTVHILFMSDDLIEGSGFKIRYDFVPR